MNQKESLEKNINTFSESLSMPKISIPKSATNKQTHCIGLGGAGTNAIEFLLSKGVKAKYTSITSDRLNKVNNEIQYIEFEGKKGWHAFKEVESITADGIPIITIPNNVLSIFNNNDNYFLFAGLGSYTGTHLVTALANILHQRNITFSCIVSSPFSFEKPSNIIAAKALEQLEKYNNTYAYSLEEIKVNNPSLTFQQLLERADEVVFEMYTEAKK